MEKTEISFLEFVMMTFILNIDKETLNEQFKE